MKKIILTSLLVMASSSAFAGGGTVGSDQALVGKPYYICSLNSKETNTNADPEILIQFADGRVIVKGEQTGTCVGEAKYMGSDGEYGAGFPYVSGYPQNESCRTFNRLYWSATGEGLASIHPRGRVELAGFISWARYSCK